MGVCKKPGCLCPLNDDEACCPDCLTPNPNYKEKLYVCDPEKNTECKKTNCITTNGYCSYTKDKRFEKTKKPGHVIIASSAAGIYDLYHGIPDLTGAKITVVDTDNKNKDFETTLVIVDKEGTEHKLILRRY